MATASGEIPIDNGSATPVSVIVTSLPEQPAKPLFKDTARLTSVAAFIFSVVTGLYATYFSWINYRQSTLETASKLIDQYYQGQEKLATLNPLTQAAYINLLRSELKAVASRAAQSAAQVQGEVDAGTWLGLAQINQYESNWKASTTAWNAAIQTTDEDYVYAFALRGLATVQVLQGKLDDANNSMDLAFRSETTDETQFKRLSRLVCQPPIEQLTPPQRRRTTLLFLGKLRIVHSLVSILILR